MEYSNFPSDVRQRVEAWLNGKYDEETKSQIKDLIENNPDELFDGFYKSLTFGTAGLRGIMGVGPNRMNIYTVGMATQGLCNYLLRDFAGLDEIKVVMAYDCRNNGRLFAETASKIFIANGITAYIFDELRPTPELSFAVRELKAQSGIVLTASHNPKEYNGYKVYWDDGGQIIAPHDKNLMDEVNKIKKVDDVKWDGDKSKINFLGDDFDEIYLERVKSLSLSPKAIEEYKDLKIVYTPIHGTGVKLVPASLKKFGFTNIIHIPEQDVTDGNFPTVISPNPEEEVAMEMALDKAKKTNADIVLATDPDADRVGVAVKDDTGKFILLNGNQSASILCYYMLRKWKENGQINGKQFIVKTIVTTELLVDIAHKFGVEYFDVLTGFKYIGGIIKKYEGKKQFIVGGEESYGYLAGDFVRDKDAVISAALLAEAAAWARTQGKTVFELLQDIYLEFGLYKESMTYIVKKGKSGAEEIQKIMHELRNDPPSKINGAKLIYVKDYLDQKGKNVISGATVPIDLPKSNVLQFFLDDGTKISIRPSGTEPKIKFYIAVKEILDSRDDYYKESQKLDEKLNAVAKELDIH